ncbi:MAG: sodium:solute symporter [Bacteroidaceae bacterium]|nr:sodium:solute symporter [Bacteroidaceae bacterium]
MALIIFISYYLLLLALSRHTARQDGNETFFRAKRRSPWGAVAFGMMGASLSGVSFVSVPGMVAASDMTYLQMCLGFIPGYLLVAFLLLPVYYKLGLTSIYSWLGQRYDGISYRTGAAFFLLSKLLGAAVRLYLVVLILQRLVLEQMGIPFAASAMLILLMIWFYTRRGGIGTIVWTDCLQTLVLLLSLILIIRSLLLAEGLSVVGAIEAVAANAHSRIFVFDDVASPQYFWKQFVSGAFIVLVMTGLDQDMMQKNLTCRSLRPAQKNMIVNSMLYLPANLLFLSLGVLMYAYASHHGVELPPSGDDVLPFLCGSGMLGQLALIMFTLGIVAAAFSSADSAMTALTTSLCIDIWHRETDERLRRRIHACVIAATLAVILLFRIVNSSSVINAVYLIASYTYGPLLGLFTYGLIMPQRFRPLPKAVPFICVSAPLLSYAISLGTQTLFGYQFSYELLLVNGFLTMLGLHLSRYLTNILYFCGTKPTIS